MRCLNQAPCATKLNLEEEARGTWLELEGNEEIGGTSKIFSSYMFPFSMTEGLYTYLVLVGVYTSEKSL